jgi:hypothetical protein
MPENKITQTKKNISLDWLVQGILTKFGETFDRLTGRNWKPSSSLATSELSERLKALLDAEVKDLDGKGKFVPHNIKLKMQWDKFSTDAESSLKKLEHELLTAAIDHINDKRYHTFAPMNLEIKPDYFTEGVKLLTSFDNFADEEEREAAINVTVPDLKNVLIAPVEEEEHKPEKEIYIAEFTVQGKTKKVELSFTDKQRRSVGRTKENDLSIDDPSVSKIHAALVLNSDRQLMVADTGSTNGTYINSQRISYGKAIPIYDTDKLKFGTVEVALEHIVKDVEIEPGDFDEDISTVEISELKNETETRGKSLAGEIYPANSQTVTNIQTPGNVEVEENSPLTGQRIVLDFDEKK